ncbi:MAG: FtsX-like permease family protein [Ktedonobacterales bacterium]
MGVETVAHDSSQQPGGDAPEDHPEGRDGRRVVAFTPLSLARLRVGRGWRLLLAAGLGILVAVVLVCSVPLYTTLVGNVQLQHVLSSAVPTDTNIESDVFTIPIVPQGAADITAAMNANAPTLSGFAAHTASYWELVQKPIPTAVTPAARTLPESPRAEPLVFDYATALPHMRISDGRLPQDATDGIPEVMTSVKMGLKPGDLLTLNYKVATPTSGKLRPLVVRVVGVWFPKDLNDPYWNGRSYDSVQLPPPPVGPPPPIDFPLLFSRGDFLSTFVPPQPPIGFAGAVASRYQIALHFVYLTDPHAITTAGADQARAAVHDYINQTNTILTLETHAPRPTAIIQGVTVGTRLDQLIASVQQELALLAQPLYIIAAQVVGLALLFVVAMASLLVESQAGELATLKSRGAGPLQLLTSYTLQGLLLATVAVALGPAAAAALSLAVVRAYVPGAGSLPPSYLAQTIAPRMVVGPALAAALLGAATLVIAAWLAARRDVLAFRREQGRSTAVALWRRSYLDLLLVLLCVAGYLDLGQFGGLNIRAQLGQTQAASAPDPFLLAAPALLLVAGALLVLRLFPLVARLGSALIARRGRGATGLLAFAQLARASAAFTRLVLLLTLAVGLALFALTFQASLGRNAAQRAAFVAGSDQRDILVLQLVFPTLNLLPLVTGLAGVAAAMPVYRSRANPTGVPVGVLGVDPASFARVAYWRADYAQQPLATLMAQMRAHTQGADAGTKGHPLWALVDDAFAANFSVQTGAVFTLNPDEATDTSIKVYFLAGAIVHDIPTMTDPNAGGNLLVDQHDYITALLNPQSVDAQVQGPNEFWLRTDGTAAGDAQRAHVIQTTFLPVASAVDRRSLAGALANDPLNAGMSGLLLAGALIAALLAVLGSLVQAAVAARQRVTQFAILRTLGAGGGQLLGILLSQQVIVFCCGVVGGTLLGLVLATATLPFLQFSTAVASAAVLRLPPATVVIDPHPLGLFYLALLVAFVLALALATRIATRTGLGKALRIGED